MDVHGLLQAIRDDCPKLYPEHLEGLECSQGLVEFLGIRPLIHSAEELEAVLIRISNNTSGPLSLEASGHRGYKLRLLRLNKADGRWHDADAYRCANAMAGDPISIQPGEALEQRVPISFDLEDYPDGRPRLRMLNGDSQPIDGIYRYGIVFSEEPWPNVVEEPGRVLFSVSSPFRLRGGA